MALHAAAREGNLDELQRLIGTIKDLNARDKHHRTALVMASWAGQVECVKALLEAGANTKIFAMDDMNAMHFAAQKGHAEVVRLLLNAGLSVNSKTRKGTNALQFAAKHGHLNVVELLVKRHANVKAQDKKGQSALDLATDDAVKAALQAALQERKQAVSEAAKKPDEQQSGAERAGTALQEPAGVSQSEAEPVAAPDGGAAHNGSMRGDRKHVRKREEPADGEALQAGSQPAKRAQKVALTHLDEEEDGEG
ncbi:hypothetical protein CVIRNUC_009067 [Coccomyxa viridis]|uniref:Uncharacterized protein n=1 Tax=Coccomyxa viridis TaxID=1274662 RepID=A0AAV1IIK4_9CHLO|nr:hypothetical protein CVIRNUC_009067 [Coccomyxa viridis]